MLNLNNTKSFGHNIHKKVSIHKVSFHIKNFEDYFKIRISVPASSKMFLNFIITSFRFISVLEKNPPFIRKLEILLTMGPLVQVTGMLMAVFETTDIRYLFLVLGYVLCVSYAYSQILMSIFDKNIVQQIMNRILGIHSNYPSFIDEQLTQKVEIRNERKFTAEIIFFIFFQLFMRSLPFDVFHNQTRNSIRSS